MPFAKVGNQRQQHLLPLAQDDLFHVANDFLGNRTDVGHERRRLEWIRIAAQQRRLRRILNRWEIKTRCSPLAAL
jgi:hypothetical protein